MAPVERQLYTCISMRNRILMCVYVCNILCRYDAMWWSVEVVGVFKLFILTERALGKREEKNGWLKRSI